MYIHTYVWNSHCEIISKFTQVLINIVFSTVLIFFLENELCI